MVGVTWHPMVEWIYVRVSGYKSVAAMASLTILTPTMINAIVDDVG